MKSQGLFTVKHILGYPELNFLDTDWKTVSNFSQAARASPLPRRRPLVDEGEDARGYCSYRYEDLLGEHVDSCVRT